MVCRCLGLAQSTRIRCCRSGTQYSEQSNAAYVHFHCCVVDRAFAVAQDGQVHVAEAAALAPEDLAAVQQRVRRRVQHELPGEGPASAGIEGKAIAACRRRAHLRVTPMSCRGGRADPTPGSAPPLLSRGAGTEFATACASRRTGSPAAACAQRRQCVACPPGVLRLASPDRSPGQVLWAVQLARIYELLPLRCLLCGSEMRVIAFVTDEPAIHSILGYLGEPTAPPEACPGLRSGVAPARGPSLWEQAAQFHWDDTPAPAPEYVFDQRVSW